MAKSKNKRKNGKTVKHNQVKRMRTQASYDLKDLMVCSVVDQEELDGQHTMKPRTMMFSAKLKSPVNLTSLQEVALKNERWKWEVHHGVICRNPDGKVYLDKQANFVCSGEYLLTELNELITDRLMANFEKANSLHRLTMYWVACPIEQETIPLEAILSPVWYYNVLGNMLTKWELETADHAVITYRTDKLEEFALWFIDQERYKKLSRENRSIKFYFEPTGVKMQKGELQQYRERIQFVWDKYNLDALSGLKFEPKATVQGFCQAKADVAHWFITCEGVASSALMTALDSIPACINCVVEMTYSNGNVDKFRFVDGGVQFGG